MITKNNYGQAAIEIRKTIGYINSEGITEGVTIDRDHLLNLIQAAKRP
jgi:hypothetical protein